MRISLVLLALCLAGCGTTPIAGSERVALVSSDAAVAGMHFVNSASGWCGVAWASDIPVQARNFGAQTGADAVLMRQTTAGNTITYTFEAWRR